MTADSKKPKKVYGYAVLAHHPTSGKAVPIETFDTEEAATADAVRRNKSHSHLGHHVKRFVKGSQ